VAVEALTGLPGGGKSYQAVVEILLPALAQGRRIITNIEGLKDDVIYDLLEKGWNIPADQIGEIVHVTDDQILSDEFYYCPPEDFAKFKLRVSDDYQSIVQPGDMAVIDEAWLFYEAKVSPIAMNFFRKHRHFVNENNVACNVVLITQDVMDIGLKVRRIIASTTVTTKMNAVGLDSCYNVKIYPKFDLRAMPTFEGKGVYRKENFKLYDSYSFKSEQNKKGRRTGVEKKSDKRGSIWSTKLMRYGLPLSVIAFIFSVYKLGSFFSKDGPLVKGLNPTPVAKVAPLAPISAAPQAGSVVSSQGQTASVLNSNASNQPNANGNNQGVNSTPAAPKEPKESNTVGVQGYYQIGDKLYVSLRVGEKQRVIVEPKDFKVQDGIRIEGIFQNEIVNTYTGGKSISLQPEKPNPPNQGEQKSSNPVN